MTCNPRHFAEAADEDDLELLRRLVKNAARCIGSEAFRAFIRRGVEFAMEQAWLYYRDSAATAGAYWRAVEFFWSLGNWGGMSCRILAELATYVARAVSKYSWPAKWPFLAMAAVAAEERGCRLPAAAAEALGPDEFAELEAFLKQGEGVVEAAGRKFAVVKTKRHLFVEDYYDRAEKQRRGNFKNFRRNQLA